MDFFNPEDVQRFFEMSPEERREAIEDWLAEVAEPWQGDSADDQLARSMVAAMNAYLQPVFNIKTEDIQRSNRHILGLWMSGYMKQVRAFQTLSALSDIKKSFEKGKEEG